jgi:hypothetical protein
MERKGDTMYELITNVVKELQFMKKLNAYYETLFQQSASPVNEQSSTVLTNTFLNSFGSEPTPNTLPSVNSRIVVSDEESSVSSEESDSTTDVDVNSDDDDDDDDDDDESFVDTIPVYTEVLKEYTDISDSVNEIPLSEITGDGQPSTVDELASNVVEPEPENPVSLEVPVEINDLMGMIREALVSGISPQITYEGVPSPVIPQKFAPYYEPEPENELPDSNHYKPVVVETDGDNIEPTVDVLPIEENTLERMSEDHVGYVKIESGHDTTDVVELDINDLVGNQEPGQEQETPMVSTTENIGEPAPAPEPTDKKQTREVYRKMNITQLRGIAVAAGISTDTTKMKKNELIQLLENLEE